MSSTWPATHSTGWFPPAYSASYRQLLPGLGNLDPDLMKSLAEFDPGNEHAVGYMWGTTAIGYNARALRKLAPDAPTDSWRLIYDPRVLAKLAHCGVSFTDARPEIIGTALLYVGADVNHAAARDLAAAARALGAIRPYVGKIHGESQISDRMLYPDAEIRARLRPLHARSNEASRAEARIWTRFETARM